MKQIPSSTYTLVYNKLTNNNNNHALVIFQAHVFSSGNGVCAAFLANYHAQSAARVMFNNRNYDLPPWSISILPDCRTDAFNTAKVRIFCGACYAMLIKWWKFLLSISIYLLPVLHFASSYWLDLFVFMKVRVHNSKVLMLPISPKLFSWETYDEDLSSLAESSRMTAPGLLEHLNVTRDTSDYLWYITR